MKKITKIIISLFVGCILITGMTGCSKLELKNADVQKLQSDLISKAEISTEKYFDKKIKANDFDISFGTEAKPNEFDNIKTLDSVKSVYLTGHIKGKPIDVVEFVLVYDLQSKKMIKFGVQTLKDDKLVDAKLEE